MGLQLRGAVRSMLGRRAVTTLEGVGLTGKAHPLQQAFIDEQTAQGGDCINDVILSGTLNCRSPMASSIRAAAARTGAETFGLIGRQRLASKVEGAPVNRHSWSVLLIIACVSTLAVADDRADYNRRSAERYVAMFDFADVDEDNVMSKGKAHGTFELEARFDDIDIDRDGNITRSELTRYIDTTFR